MEKGGLETRPNLWRRLGKGGHKNVSLWGCPGAGKKGDWGGIKEQEKKG